MSKGNPGRALYQPKGAAREYGDLAASVYLRCPHACRYCYCPQMLHISPSEFFQAPTPRPGFLQALEHDLRREVGKQVALDWSRPPQVVLSFVGDPYCPQEAEYKQTRQAIELCHSYDFPVRILTKGGKLAERDFDLLGPRDAFGVTVTTISAEDAAKWEPGAAPPHYRLMTIRHANTLGIPTWVSVEPVFDPEGALYAIQAASLYADEIKIGRWNHSKEAAAIDWRKFAADAAALCERLGVKYVLKRGLSELL